MMHLKMQKVTRTETQYLALLFRSKTCNDHSVLLSGFSKIKDSNEEM